MKILIIGARGFIGSHCVDFFSKNHEVWSCDIILDYDIPRYIPIDAVDSDFLEIFQKEVFDICINCSGAANVTFSLDKPFNDFKLNTLNVFKILEAIRMYSPDCRFVTMSSAAVYGNPESLPIKEKHKRNPVSPYGYHKVMAEMICEEYYRFWNVKTCCLRIFSAYGPRLKKQLFWDMYNKVKNEKILTLWGTGNETRDFIYVKDIVRIIDLIITNDLFDGSVYNVGVGIQTKISDVAKTFVELLGEDKKITFNGNVRKGDPLNWEADISKFKELGFIPSYSLREGIQEYINWIEREYE